MKFIHKHHHAILTIILAVLQDVYTVDILCNDDQCDTRHQFDISTQISGNTIDMTWTFNESVLIYGFQPVIYNTDREILYESPLLHPSQRSMKISHELDKQNYICVNAYLNRTHVLAEQCKSIETSDFKAVIGILAGTIFLIPCMIGLSYILYKDYQKNKDEGYSQIDVEVETKQLLKQPLDKRASTVKGGKKTNKSTELVLKVNITDCTGVENRGYLTDDRKHDMSTRPVVAAVIKQGDESESNKQHEDKTTLQIDDKDNNTVIIASEHL